MFSKNHLSVLTLTTYLNMTSKQLCASLLHLFWEQFKMFGIKHPKNFKGTVPTRPRNDHMHHTDVHTKLVCPPHKNDRQRCFLRRTTMKRLFYLAMGTWNYFHGTLRDITSGKVAMILSLWICTCLLYKVMFIFFKYTKLWQPWKCNLNK